MEKRLIECVPNFSEGRDMSIIKQITDEIESVEGVKLLNVDPGKATNRTVVTFVGSPEPVIEAAFLAIRKASQLIDMSKHSGEHPRFGATDVCPLIPIAGISMEETAEYARKLGKRAGEELNIPIYLYENAASTPKRRNLAAVRSGEYEGLKEKLAKPEWKPDFGPTEFNAKSGATAISARDFLIAYNVNLNTTSVRRANSIAFDIRENGRVKRHGDPITGEIATDSDGNTLRIPGSLKSVKAIGWYIEEFGVAQISMNLTNIRITPLHIAFEETCRRAEARGIRVTGSEVVGLVPLQAMLDAADHYLEKQQRSKGIDESEKIKIAVKSMGLDELYPFDPDKKIIEYMIRNDDDRPLVKMPLNAFADETASESMAPGGGSISAYVGALGASLGTMVANLSAHKRGWDDKWKHFSKYAEQGQRIKDELLYLVDEDTVAFNKIIESFRLPKGSEEEKAIRKQAIQDATKYAIDIPFKVMQVSASALDMLEMMVKEGNPNSVTDAAVGALCVRTAVQGAYLNVRINAADLKDEAYKSKVLAEAKNLESEVSKQVIRISEHVDQVIGK